MPSVCVLLAGRTSSTWTSVLLEACTSAIAAGDGRDLWRQPQGGQLVNVGAGKCAVADEAGHVTLADCDSARGHDAAASQWEMQGNGQWKLASPDGRCLTQHGSAPGDANLAARAAVTATSTATAAHGAAC